jgi:hypothetical protein
MKRFHILVVALFAVFAFGAVAATSAMAGEEETMRCVPKTEGLWGLQTSTIECAEELATANSPFELISFLLAEWLVKGEEVTTTLLVETKGTLLLEDLKATLGIKGTVLCEGILDGSIGSNGEDEIIEVLNAAGTKSIPTKVLEGEGLLCNGQEGCLTGTENAEVWASGLPWLTLLELVEEESPTLFQGFVVLILPHAGGTNPGWYTKCSTALGTSEDECLAGEAMAEASNITGGVNGEFSEPFTLLVGGVLGNCSASSEKETGLVEGLGEEKLAGSSEVLTVSSTG